MNNYFECLNCYYNKLDKNEYLIGEIINCEDCGAEYEIIGIKAIKNEQELTKLPNKVLKKLDLKTIVQKLVENDGLLLLIVKEAERLAEDFGE